MNIKFKTIFSLILVTITLSVFSQENATILISYMKVSPSEIDDYTEIEKEWKKIHRARLQKGHITGWQLWQKMYAGDEDEYQYIVINWYKNFQSTNETGFQEIIQELYSPEELEELLERTLSSRSAVRTDVMHMASATEFNEPTNYLVVSPMKVHTGKEAEYLKMERDIFKPIHQEAIRQGLMGSWSVWYKWPFEENDHRYLVMNGFEDYPQLSNLDYGELFKKVHPELELDELWLEVPNLRINTSVQIWRLIDSVYEGDQQD